jgi:hypothetical protein
VFINWKEVLLAVFRDGVVILKQNRNYGRAIFWKIRGVGRLALNYSLGKWEFEEEKLIITARK